MNKYFVMFYEIRISSTTVSKMAWADTQQSVDVDAVVLLSAL
jgi:hypothetical protein